MNEIYWNTIAENKEPHLVLLHGWALNAEIWRNIVPLLKPYFCLHLVDLPGFGRSKNINLLTLSEIAYQLLPYLPSKCLILGWSFGGLVATQLALDFPTRISALINVASSPCFGTRANWPGISKEKLQYFYHQLNENFLLTVEKFIDMQTWLIGRKQHNFEQLKKLILSQPISPKIVLKNSFNILQNTDLRNLLPQLKIPFLRIYGALDVLVPSCIASILDDQLPNSYSIIIKNSGHAPFISHSQIFCKYIVKFMNNLDCFNIQTN